MASDPTLPGLPTELIVMIADCVYESRFQIGAKLNLSPLRSLAALARTNRRLNDIVGPILYNIGIKSFGNLPLAWAAKKGVAGTLEKALDNGADPNWQFKYTATEAVLVEAYQFRDSAVHWESNNPGYWPMGQTYRSQVARIAREATPTLTHLDVYAPVGASVSLLAAQEFMANMVRSQRNATLNGNGPSANHTSHNPDGSDAADDIDGVPYDPTTSSETSSNDDMDEDMDDEDIDDDGMDFFPWDGHHDHGFHSDEDDEEEDEGASVVRKHTALHIAAKEGHDDLIKILLDRGADIESSSAFFCNCPPEASQWHILEDPGFNLNGPPSWTPLHVAICSHRLETAKLLISREANIEYPEERPYLPPIHQAAARGHLDLLKFMLEENPYTDIDCEDCWGLTPLYYAAVNRQWETNVPFLMSRGANVNKWIHFDVGRVEMTTTMLAEACRFGRFDDAEKLLELGAETDCDFTTRPAYRPGPPSVQATRIPLLHLCCMQLPPVMLPIDGFYREPMSSIPGLTQQYKAHSFITNLVAKGAPNNWRYDNDDHRSALSVATVHLNPHAICALLDAGTDVNTCDTKSRNALMNLLGPLPQHPQMTVINGHYLSDHRTAFEKLLLTVIQELLRAGIRINHQDRDGKTVLHIFLEGFRTRSFGINSNTAGDVLRLLLAGGADPCVKDSRGFTALHTAIHERLLWATSILTRYSSKTSIKDLFDRQGFIDALDRIVAGANARLGAAMDSHPTVPRSEVREFIDLILDMDYEGHFLSDGSFFNHYLSNISPTLTASTGPHLIEVICLRALPFMIKGLDSKSLLTLARTSLKKRCYRLALQLVLLLPRDTIDELDHHSETMLFQAITCTPHRDTGPEVMEYHKLLEELLRRGADLHRPIMTSRQHEYVDGSITPLMLAITLPIGGWDRAISSMLSIQPIKGNSKAASQLYLHRALSPDVLSKVGPGISMSPRTGSFIYASMIRALLQHGADTTQLDQDGNTPLSFFIEQHLENMRRTSFDSWLYPYVLPLSRGVDLRLKNIRGKSGIDLLEEYQKQFCHYSPDFPPDTYRVVTRENGERDVLWNTTLVI
ncbi:hypothetical protein QBC38DRAFT_489022 [Podospora fimiseda]|uniref:Ankyrin n=1 Tax=Podospora fimiseda TaxID=252190 RepID=A0AAN7BG28_9PEZI|nr:hypothetical protein QBC38DRAFT_489022 [Podospora fimiseda]